jgi:hypothetical protein
MGNATGIGGNNYGILGQSTAAAATNYGVYGYSTSGTTVNYGVYGGASGASGTNYGGYFTNNSTTTTHKYGSWNEATGASSGDNVGILGKALNSTGKNYGVYGTALGSAGTYTYGGYFENVATTNNNKFGAYGVASGVSDADNWGVYGLASGSTHQNTGCVGIANVATTGTNVGGTFYAGGGAANYAIVTNGGNVGFGTLTPGNQLQVTAQLAGYVAYIQNTNGTATSHGLIIQAGSTTTSGANLVVFTKPGGTTLGAITQSNVGYVTYTSASDRRLKNNILNTHFGISDLMKIQVRDYVYKADASKTQVTGFIAQELYEVFPNAVSKPAKAEEMWSVDYGKVTPLLAKAIQDQQQTIETLKTTAQGQQATIEAQQKQIDELKKMVELLIKK